MKLGQLEQLEIYITSLPIKNAEVPKILLFS